MLTDLKPLLDCILHQKRKVRRCFFIIDALSFLSFSPSFYTVILNWFVDPPVARAAINDDKLIEEEEVECRPEKIPCSVLDENVDVCLVRQYFSSDAWKLVEEVMKNKAKNVWVCTTCQNDLHSKQSIICESCLMWYHFSCVGLTKQPKLKNWFCS